MLILRYAYHAITSGRSQPSRRLHRVSRGTKRLSRRNPAFLSQPAVSRALQRLRDMFHDDLLMRTAASYEPTLQGQSLIEEVKVFLLRLDHLLSEEGIL